jgi:hypothetical protein
MTVAILGAAIAGLFAAGGIVVVNRAAMRRRIEHAVRWGLRHHASARLTLQHLFDLGQRHRPEVPAIDADV